MENQTILKIVAELRRIQTEGENIFDNTVIFIADNDKNYYIQC